MLAAGLMEREYASDSGAGIVGLPFLTALWYVQ